MKVAFAGLGNMGAPMARNLLRAGHEVTVYNRTRAKAEPLVADGARVADSVKEAAQWAEAAITMLADDQAVRDAVFGAGDRDGMLHALQPGAIHMGMSTISVELSKRLAEAHASVQQGYIASPVLGRPEAAAAQKLWLIAAGRGEHLERCRPLMDALGRGVTIAGGEPWQANIIKIAANFTLASMLETLGEAIALMRKAGVDAGQFLEVVNSLYQSPVYANYGKIIAEEKYEPAGFRMKLGLKDVNLALEAAGAQAVPMPLASLLHDHYLEGIARGLGEYDWSAVAKIAAEHAAITKAPAGG
jgi:3-hydroxyisobutyrate dehydrogenase-like beta-hydroxyacid dehydrogenase